jgi:hypothetical protein
MSDIEKEVTVVRVRGKLTLTCSQNETELGNVFKYLLEKVRELYVIKLEQRFFEFSPSI